MTFFTWECHTFFTNSTKASINFKSKHVHFLLLNSYNLHQKQLFYQLGRLFIEKFLSRSVYLFKLLSIDFLIYFFKVA